MYDQLAEVIEIYKGFEIKSEQPKNGFRCLFVQIEKEKYTTETDETLWQSDGDNLNKNWRNKCIQALRSNVDNYELRPTRPGSN